MVYFISSQASHNQKSTFSTLPLKREEKVLFICFSGSRTKRNSLPRRFPLELGMVVGINVRSVAPLGGRQKPQGHIGSQGTIRTSGMYPSTARAMLGLSTPPSIQRSAPHCPSPPRPLQQKQWLLFIGPFTHKNYSEKQGNNYNGLNLVYFMQKERVSIIQTQNIHVAKC